jgi:hypothetical protein
VDPEWRGLDQPREVGEAHAHRLDVRASIEDDRLVFG